VQGSEAVLCCAVLCCSVLCCSVGNSISGGRGSLNKLPALQYIPALDSNNKEAGRPPRSKDGLNELHAKMVLSRHLQIMRQQGKGNNKS
jgi:hypothetical protein